jgi:YegS/Rv2252/BmrU family lipid kinase
MRPSCPVVFLNRSSGFRSTGEVSKRLQEEYTQAGVPVRVELVQAGMDVEALAREAVRQGADAIVAGGGDGTLRAVAAALAYTDTIMGILPVGTWNHFARDLHIPLNVTEAARTLLTGESAAVDLAEVNGRVFINNSHIGLYPSFRFHRQYAEQHGKAPWRAILWAALMVFRRRPAYTLRFHMDDRAIRRRSTFIMVANNEHAMEGYRLGTRAAMTEGHLYVYIMRPRSRLDWIRIALSVILGRFSRQRHFDVYRTRELWIEGRQKRLGVSLDGEIAIIETPLHYRTLPRAIRVIVPPASAAAAAAQSEDTVPEPVLPR